MSIENPDAEAAVTDVSPEPATRAPISRFKVALVAVLILFGPVGALAVYFGSEPLYESQARILVKYVVDRRDSTGDGDLRLPESVRRRDKSSIVGAEIEILTSRDLANQVAEEMGVERLAPNGAAGEESLADAVEVITNGLEVEAAPGTSVLTLRFRHSDPELVVTILETIVEQYFVRHLEIHRGYGDADAEARELGQEMEIMRMEWKGLGEQLTVLTQDAKSEPEVVRALADRQIRIEAKLREMKSVLKKVSRGYRSMPNIDIVQRPALAQRVREKEVVSAAITLAFLGPMIGAMLGLLLLRRPA